MPYAIKSDFGPSFMHTWEQELKSLGVRVIHSSAYNSQIMGLVERSVTHVKRYTQQELTSNPIATVRIYLRHQ